MTDAPGREQIVIIGGGFAGLACARSLRRADVAVTLIDRDGMHIFQPLLYQVATAALSEANVTAPLRRIFRGQKNCRVLRGEVNSIDPDGKMVHTNNGSVPFDRLVLAAGSRTHPIADKHPPVPGLKELPDARAMRHRILANFEEAEWCEDPAERRRLLRFVVVGGGPSGVELAGAIAELARTNLRNEFHRFRPADEVEIHLFQSPPVLLPGYPEKLQQRAVHDLQDLGVHVHLNRRAKDIEPQRITWEDHQGLQELQAGLVIWAAGVTAEGLARSLADQLEVDVQGGGRIPVDQYCRLAGREDLLAIGDIAAIPQNGEDQVPGLAPAAVQAGRYAARSIKRSLRGHTKHKPFRYVDKGIMAVVGRNRAVARIGKLKFGGRFAWWLWLLVHLMTLAGYENRMMVLTRWFIDYVSQGSGARVYAPQARSEKAIGRQLMAAS